MSRYTVLVALALVAAFLLHDGWMAHAGHIIYDGGPMTHAMLDAGDDHRHDDMASPIALTPVDAVITPEPPLPGHDTCTTVRIGAPNPAPGLALTSFLVAILPVPPPHAGGSERIQPFAQPPTHPPAVRRALIQVFLI
ncbi:MAG: hypothetical protein QM753_16805 [Thermomicrobiales bacterium]